MPPGTMVVVRPKPADQVRVGDVVTYQLRSGEPEVVTHRVVAVGMDGAGRRVFRTQGDADDTPDPAWVRSVQLKGVRWYAVPQLGRVTNVLDGTERQAALTLVVGALLAYAAFMFGADLRDRRRRRPRPGGAGHRCPGRGSTRRAVPSGKVMAEHRKPPPARWRSVRLRALLCLGVAGGRWGGSFAFWTDDVTITGTTFTAGVLDLQVNTSDSYTTTTLGMSGHADAARQHLRGGPHGEEQRHRAVEVHPRPAGSPAPTPRRTAPRAR